MIPAKARNARLTDPEFVNTCATSGSEHHYVAAFRKTTGILPAHAAAEVVLVQHFRITFAIHIYGTRCVCELICAIVFDDDVNARKPLAMPTRQPVATAR